MCVTSNIRWSGHWKLLLTENNSRLAGNGLNRFLSLLSSIQWYTSSPIQEIASYKIFSTEKANVARGGDVVWYFCHWFIWCLFGAVEISGWLSETWRRLLAQSWASLTVWGKVLIVCDINLGRWHPNFVLGNCQHQHSQCSHHMITQPRHSQHPHHPYIN